MSETGEMKLGVVVVGLGIAGRVRVRDIIQSSTEPGCRWSLVGYVSRRDVDIDGASQLPETEALTRSDVDAVLVCTEPGAHEDTIRKSLDAGKHVLVEFPVTTSLQSTREMYNLAQENGLVLHEENIALLTQSFLDMSSRLETITQPIVKVEVNFVGSYNGWVEDFARSGGPFCVNVSIVQTLYLLFGADLAATWASLEIDEDGFTATAQLTAHKCSDMTVSLRRTKEKSKRLKTLKMVLADGTVIDDSAGNVPPPTNDTTVPASKKPGLFMQDFLLFVQEVYKERDYSADTERVLHCMAVVEQINKHMSLKSYM